MNWEALGAVGELAGAFVIVATIIYLSRQIRESNRHAKAEAEREVQSQWHNVTDALLRDHKVREIVRKGADSFEELSGDEKTAYMLYLTHVINQLEMVLKMERDGLLSQDIADTFRAVAGQVLSTPGGREYWKLGSGLYQELSTLHVNQYLDGAGVSITETLPFWSAKSTG